MDNQDNFDEIENAAAEKRQVQDFDDLNNERSGDNVGRISRFGLEQTTTTVLAQRKKEYQTLLEHLLTSVAYREAYERTLTILSKVENEIYEALIEASENLSLSESKLTVALDHAQESPDGTKIFSAKDGSVFREDGTQLSASIAADIDWRDDATSWQEYTEARKSRDNDQERFDQLSGYDAELNEIRGQMENKNTPPTLDELDGLKDRMNQIHNSIGRQQMAESNFIISEPNDVNPQALVLDLSGM